MLGAGQWLAACVCARTPLGSACNEGVMLREKYIFPPVYSCVTQSVCGSMR